MIKKTVKYIDVIQAENGNIEEVKKEEDVRFFFTLPAVRLYEQRTGKHFFEEYKKAFTVFANTAKSLQIPDTKSITTEQQLIMAPIIFDQTVNGFMMDFIPCMYTDFKEYGRLRQDEETADMAENSLWLMELVNINFFTEIFSEIMQNQSAEPAKKRQKVKKN